MQTCRAKNLQEDGDPTLRGLKKLRKDPSNQLQGKTWGPQNCLNHENPGKKQGVRRLKKEKGKLLVKSKMFEEMARHRGQQKKENLVAPGQ